MKDFINTYYNLKIKKIYTKDGINFFFINNEKIIVEKVKYDEKHLDDLIIITNRLFADGIKVNTFIKNSLNNYYIKKDDYYIVLMKENDINNNESLSKINIYGSIDINFSLFEVNKVWENEVDNIEKELIEYNKEFSKIQNSVDYFLGLAENAIELFNNHIIEISNLKTGIGHLLDYKLFSNNQINNPFSFIKVNRMYDISNYIKYCFFTNKLNYEEINIIIRDSNETEKIFLFACLLYPSAYFSLIKRIMLKEIDEYKVDLFVNNIVAYKKLLCYIQSIINNKSVNMIKWMSE